MRTVLVIEEDDVDFSLTNKLLENLEFQVIRSYNITDALAMLDVLIFDLVVVDAHKPENRDAIEMASILKKNFPSLPVLMQSTNAYPYVIVNSFYAGCEEYLLMPFAPEIFYQKLAKIFYHVKNPCVLTS